MCRSISMYIQIYGTCDGLHKSIENPTQSTTSEQILPHRGGSQCREPQNNSFNKNKKGKLAMNQVLFLMGSQHILHARSCNPFQKFPHARHGPLGP